MNSESLRKRSVSSTPPSARDAPPLVCRVPAITRKPTTIRRRPFTPARMARSHGRRPRSSHTTTVDSAQTNCRRSFRSRGCCSGPLCGRLGDGRVPPNARWPPIANALGTYARRRNDVRRPHAVSRMSCVPQSGDGFHIANNGVRFVAGFARHEQVRRRDCQVARNRLRAHTFASPRYFQVEAVPAWARDYLNRQLEQNGRQQKQSVSWDDLAAGNSHDATWNAMQRYLVDRYG